MRACAAVPLGLALAVHRPIGRLFYRLAPKLRHTVRRNLETCFPELDAEAIETLAKRHFEALAMSIPESAAAWFGSDRDIARRFDVLGLEHLNAALVRGKGVILYTGHFTTLEICGCSQRCSAIGAARCSRRSSGADARGSLTRPFRATACARYSGA